MRLLCGLLASLLPACAATRGAARSAWNDCSSRGLERNVVVCDDQPFARLDCLGGNDTGCKAVRVRMVQPAATALYCAPGFALDKPADAANRKSIKFDLQLSPDQTQIWFSGGDLFGRSWQVYSPADGALTAFGGGEKWLQRELSRDDAARPLCGPAK